jgi:hypothetical protein
LFGLLDVRGVGFPYAQLLGPYAWLVGVSYVLAVGALSQPWGLEGPHLPALRLWVPHGLGRPGIRLVLLLGPFRLLYGTLAGRAFAGEDEFVSGLGASAGGAVRSLGPGGGCLGEPAAEVGRLLW